MNAQEVIDIHKATRFQNQDDLNDGVDPDKILRQMYEADIHVAWDYNDEGDPVWYPIFGRWKEIGITNLIINQENNPKALKEWLKVYSACNSLDRQIPYRSDKHILEEMRLGHYDESTADESMVRLATELGVADILQETGKATPHFTKPFYQIPEGLLDIESLFGYDHWGFFDDTTVCDNCYKALNTQPQYHGWQPDYDSNPDTGLTHCKECLVEDMYLESRMNRNRLVQAWIVDPEEHGWTELDFRYENGWHIGQNDDPQRVIEVLNEASIDVLFTASLGQFDINFYPWVKLGMEEVATFILKNADVTLPYDPGTEMSKALKGQSSKWVQVQHSRLPGGGVYKNYTIGEERDV